MKISMRDVAEHAGVSVATVSHVINQTRYVSEDTVIRVQNSIRELGYIPDPIGRIFKTGKKNLIGFIVPDIANPVWAIIIEEVESVLSTHGSKLIIINTKEDERRELENIQLHFILSGHQRIGIITGQMRLSTSQVRLNAYKAAMKHYNLPIEPEYIQYGDSLAKSSVLLLPPTLKAQCTALVVSNNIMTSDVLQYLDDQGIRIGTDISLLGQGVENNLDYSLQKMDLMVQPSGEIGRKAGEQILKRINQPQMPIQNIVLYSRLLKRELSHSSRN